MNEMTDYEPAELFKLGWIIGVKASVWNMPSVLAADMNDRHPFKGATHLRSDQHTEDKPGNRKVALHADTWAGIWQVADRFIARSHPAQNTITGMRFLENGTVEIQCRSAQ